MNAKRVQKDYLVDLFANAQEFEVKGGVVRLGYNGQNFYAEMETAAKLLGIKPYETAFAKAKLDLSVPKAGSGDYSIKSEDSVGEVEYLKKAGELKDLPADIASGNEDVYKRLIV